MIRRLFSTVFFILFVLLWLAACALPPSPRGGAPVVDRSIYPGSPPSPPAAVSQVEVQPLPRPQPITPQKSNDATPDDFEQTTEKSLQSSTTPQPFTRQAASQATEISRQGSQAVVALLDSAANYVSDEEWEKAAAALERALRIEPKNAGIWHDLAQIRLQQRDYQQAESLASKSNSLAGDDNFVRARNWRLIAIARRAIGDDMGADAAEAQAVTLER